MNRAVNSEPRSGQVGRVVARRLLVGAVVLAAVIALPILIAGIALAVSLWRGGAPSGSAVSITVWVLAGAAGLFALARARALRDAELSATGRVERLCACLALGVVAALAVIGVLASMYWGSIRSDSVAVTIGASIAGAHGVLIAGALGAASTLMHRHATATGQPFDTLPLTLLLLALGLALAGVLLTAMLA